MPHMPQHTPLFIHTCREFGLWHLDEESPGYYAAPGARYLTYDNNVRQVVDQVGALLLFS